MSGRVGRALVRPAAVGLRGVLPFGFFMADAYIPLLLIDVRGANAAAAGLALTSATLAWSAGAWIQARFVQTQGIRFFVGLGFGVVAAGLAATLAVLMPAVPWAVAVATWGVAGLGMGLSYSALSLAVLREAPPAEVGAATSALQLSDTLGTALGTGVAGAVTAAGERAAADPWIALAAAFAIGASVAVLGSVGARRLHGAPSRVAGDVIAA